MLICLMRKLPSHFKVNPSWSTKIRTTSWKTLKILKLGFKMSTRKLKAIWRTLTWLKRYGATKHIQASLGKLSLILDQGWRNMRYSIKTKVYWSCKAGYHRHCNLDWKVKENQIREESNSRRIRKLQPMQLLRLRRYLELLRRSLSCQSSLESLRTLWSAKSLVNSVGTTQNLQSFIPKVINKTHFWISLQIQRSFHKTTLSTKLFFTLIYPLTQLSKILLPQNSFLNMTEHQTRTKTTN